MIKNLPFILGFILAAPIGYYLGSELSKAIDRNIKGCVAREAIAFLFVCIGMLFVYLFTHMH